MAEGWGGFFQVMASFLFSAVFLLVGPLHEHGSQSESLLLMGIYGCIRVKKIFFENNCDRYKFVSRFNLILVCIQW